jgi:hypothetical protein
MWPPTLTDCECEQAGWCERHQCLKAPHFHLLCRRQEKYFQLYEQGRGPCLPVADEAQASEAANTDPGLLRKSANFGKALVRHIANGGKHVSEEVFEARKSVCLSCSSCDQERMVCREPDCGCDIEKKARWASEDCPLGKWPSQDAEPVETQTAD